MTKLNRITNLALLVLLLAGVSYGQQITAATTLSAAVTQSATQWCVTSATNVQVPSLASAQGGSVLVSGREAAQVQGAGISSTCFRVQRGVLGTRQIPHATGVPVWVFQAAVTTGDSSRPITAATLSFMAGLYGNQGFPPYTAYTTLSPPNAIAVTAKAGVQGSTFFDQIYIPASTVLTGACLLNSSTVTNNAVIYALYDFNGNLLVSTVLTGTTTATASKYQCIAFTGPFAIGPGAYFMAVQTNGTDTFAAYAANGAPTNYATGSKTGTFGTLPNPIAPTVTFTADVGPLMMVY